MRWIGVVGALALSACNVPADKMLPSESMSPYESMIDQGDVDPDADAVFASVEEHAKCAGFYRAFAKLASGTNSKAEFYATAAKDAEIAATEIAGSKISKELAVDMVDQLAHTHAARWAYAIEANAKSDGVQSQANKCFQMAREQEEIIREVVKAKYGFRRR